MSQSTATFIRKMRKRSGLTAKEFCDLIGCHWRTLSDWERDVTEIPPIKFEGLKAMDAKFRLNGYKK